MGGGPEFAPKLLEQLEIFMTPEERKVMKETPEDTQGPRSDYAKAMETPLAEVHTLATAPLQSFSGFTQSLDRASAGLSPIDANCEWDVSYHEASHSAVAQSMLKRMKEDVAYYANKANKSKILRTCELDDKTISRFLAEGSDEDKDKMKQAFLTVVDLVQQLEKLRDQDAANVQSMVPLLEKVANFVDLNEKDQAKRAEKLQFVMRHEANLEPSTYTEYLFGSLLSSRSTEDLVALNPYLSNADAEALVGAVSVTVLRANRMGHVNRAIGAAVKLQSLILKAMQMETEERTSKHDQLLANIVQACEGLAGQLSAQRHYVHQEEKEMHGFAFTEHTYDPRFLIFEFTWNILLRDKQVEIVTNFCESLCQGKSLVKQMIMGAGKTTVVAPLLALMLADGDSLVLSVVPKALLEMTRKQMRETFATIMSKRIYTLQFDRSTEVTPNTSKVLANAAKNRGVVVATPTTIKSVMLCFVETLENLHSATGTAAEKLRKNAKELSKVLQLFQEGVMLLDEVDLILHPLKSELNFPCGDKFDLDASESGERWGLPIHLMDAMFFADTGKVSVYEQQGTALTILQRLSAVIEEGFKTKSLQRLPHVQLLNKEFYHEKMKPVLADWSYLWLQKQHLHGITREEAVQYVLEGAAAKSEGTIKINLIDQEIKKIQIQLGEISDEPEPTPGLKRSGSGKAGEYAAHTAQLKRVNSKSAEEEGTIDFLKKEMAELLAARAVSEETDSLINQIYMLDQQFEVSLNKGATDLAKIQLRVTEANKQIEDLETPRDASLDNSVIVWYSSTFSKPTSENTGAISEVHAICSLLEEMGMTVVRCGSVDEVRERVHPLQVAGRLRCVIVGGQILTLWCLVAADMFVLIGGENMDRCGPSCEDYHTGNCCVCGQDWNQHGSHTCPDGRRSAWAIGDSGFEAAAMEMLAGLIDPNTEFAKQYSSVPTDRAIVYGGESKISKDDRMKVWGFKVQVLYEAVHMQKIVRAIPEWEVEDESPAVAAVGAPPAGLSRTKSQGTAKLELLREELEDLEGQKQAILDREEQLRKERTVMPAACVRALPVTLCIAM